MVITWDAPTDAPDDYRVTWKKSTAKWPSYRNANTALGGNAFPTGTSHTVTGLEEGTAYQARVRARYFNDNGNLEQSGPWSDAVEITISATPSQDGEGDSNEGPSTDPPATLAATRLAPPEEPRVARAVSGAEFRLDGQELDTTGACNESDVASVSAACTIDIFDTIVVLRIDGTPQANAEFDFYIGRTNALASAPGVDPVADEGDLPEDEDSVALEFEAGRNLLLLYDAVEDSTHYFRVNVLPDRESDPVEFLLDQNDLFTDGNCNEDNIEDVTDHCTYNIYTRTVRFELHGTVDSDDRLSVKIGRDKAAVDAASAAADASDLRGTDQGVNLTFPEGRSLMRLWGDEDGSPGGSEEHFFRVNLVPFLELNGDRLSKSDDCRSETDRSAAQITDDDCIVTQFGNAPKIRFRNVTTDQFNVYVHVNGTEVIREPGNTELAGSFTLDIQDGDNVVKVRLASKTGTHFAESYGSDSFYYKVTARAGSSDATLKYIAVHPSRGDLVELNPTFSPEITDYTLTVASLHQTTIINAISNDSNATIEFLDKDDTTIPIAISKTLDGDFLRRGIDSNLDVGDNLFKIWVTAEDTITTWEYQITITRLDFVVSNLGQAFGGGFTVNAANTGVATQFTTGNETDGYRISQVRLHISAASGTIPRVSIYSDSSGQPGSSLKVLTNPGTIPDRITGVEFGADNYKLESSTPYWIVVERASGSGEVAVLYTGSTAEDTGSAAGWSIGDNGSSLSGGTWSAITGGIEIPRIAVKGTVESSDATLSDLALTDASGNAVDLDPTFASDTTSYNATVANSVSQIKVGPTANDSNATIEYLDDSDMTLADDDASTPDVFDFDLNVGANVVKVKVTAVDSTTTKTYTVTVTRLDVVLVSNLGQDDDGYATIRTGSESVQFTTGSETDGYRISQVRLDISAASGTIPRVSIYSDSSGQPGSSLKVLTNPGAIPTTATEVDFGADNYKLDPGTSYWIVVERASGSAPVTIAVTDLTAEDTGSAAGWSIGDNGLFRDGGTWSTTPNEIIIPRIAVRGTVAPAVSTDATLSALALKDASNNAVALSPAFASATTSYNTTVANSISQIKVEPTANDSNATIEYLDDSDATLTDEDTGTAVFDFDLDVGPNVVKVKVTAEDSSTTETYQVTITRLATTPGAPATLTATRGDTEVDLRWTAPASDGGAAITKYQYRVSADGGTNWAPDWTDVPDGSDSGTDLGDERTVTAANLANGTEYTFQVRAVNSEGSGGGIEATATPTATVVAPAGVRRRHPERPGPDGRERQRSRP